MTGLDSKKGRTTTEKEMVKVTETISYTDMHSIHMYKK
jgi:hypothetical protein